MSQDMLNQGLIEKDQYHQLGMASQIMSGFSCINPINFNSTTFDPFQQSFKPFNTISSSFAIDNHVTSTTPKSRVLDHDLSMASNNMPQLVSYQRSNLNLWAWGEGKEYQLGIDKSSSGEDHHHHHHLGVSAMKMKKMIKGRRKMREPRFCFKTMSDVDVLDDGYKWRKYGQKVVKNTLHPRSYYRCTQEKCRVKKRVERMAEDPRMVITTYEGRHVHSPSHDLHDSQHTQPLLNNFF